MDPAPPAARLGSRHAASSGPGRWLPAERTDAAASASQKGEANRRATEAALTSATALPRGRRPPPHHPFGRRLPLPPAAQAPRDRGAGSAAAPCAERPLRSGSAKSATPHAAGRAGAAPARQALAKPASPAAYAPSARSPRYATPPASGAERSPLRSSHPATPAAPQRRRLLPFLKAHAKPAGPG